MSMDLCVKFDRCTLHFPAASRSEDYGSTFENINSRLDPNNQVVLSPRFFVSDFNQNVVCRLQIDQHCLDLSLTHTHSLSLFFSLTLSLSLSLTRTLSLSLSLSLHTSSSLHMQPSHVSTIQWTRELGL